jgi:hypothetical protein
MQMNPELMNAVVRDRQSRFLADAEIERLAARASSGGGAFAALSRRIRQRVASLSRSSNRRTARAL